MKIENIKFRGKSKKTGRWLYGDLVRNVEGDFAIVPPFEMTMYNFCSYYEVCKKTIGQLVAKIRKSNGDICEVYSQDIVKLTAHDGKTEYVMVDDKGFVDSKFLNFRILIRLVNDFDVEWEVVGNIYDNKELLTQEYERID